MLTFGFTLEMNPTLFGESSVFDPSICHSPPYVDFLALYTMFRSVPSYTCIFHAYMRQNVTMTMVFSSGSVGLTKNWI